ncbi:MAG: cyclase family protein [Oscillospiraceae bacterium]|jgi:kynurenine formamidase|nr:cyclase family protein [Oscillospiraceae bacterium]
MSIIDISHTLGNETPVYPGDIPLSLAKHRAFEADGHTSYLLKSGLHTGTHVDMPMHMTGDLRTCRDFPAQCFAGRGVLLDARGEEIISMKPFYRDAVTRDDIVLLYTGFDAKYGEEEYFTKHPAVSKELYDFLISRGIRMLGIDMPGPDFAPFECHRALLSNGIFILENLCGLGAMLGKESFEVFALPLKIQAEASFVRAVCTVA